MSQSAAGGRPLWRRALGVAAAGIALGWVGWAGRGDPGSWNGALDEKVALAVANAGRPAGSPLLAVEARPGRDRSLAPRRCEDPLPVVVAGYDQVDATRYHEWPPGALDLAVLLDSLSGRGVAAVVLAIPPTWRVPPEGTLATKALATAHSGMGAVPVVAAFEPGQSAAPAADAGALFQAVPSFALAQVVGEAAGLPVANDAGPPPVAGFPPSDLAFSRLLLLEGGAAAGGGRVNIPLLARAGDRILPSLPLLAWARRHGHDLARAVIVPGDAIRFGDVRVPVDRAGRLQLPFADLDRIRSCSVMELTEDRGGPDLDGLAVVVGHGAQHVSDLPDGHRAGPAQLAALALGALETCDFGLPVVRLQAPPRWVEVAVLVGMGVAAAASLWLPQCWRLAAAGLVLVAWVVAAAAVVQAGFFPAFCGPGLGGLVGFGVAQALGR